MRIHATAPLFAWAELEDSPSLVTIRAVLQSLPDQDLLDGLQRARGHGRDDYPVRVLWGVTVLAVLCRHVWATANHIAPSAPVTIAVTIMPMVISISVSPRRRRRRGWREDRVGLDRSGARMGGVGRSRCPSSSS